MKYKIVSFIGFAMLACAAVAKSQSPVLWHNLKQGPYSVGFRMEWKYDYARSWGNGARPLRINIWYPAVKTTGKKMLYEKYVFNTPPDSSFTEYNNALVKYDVGDSTKSLLGCYDGSQLYFKNLLKTPVNAVFGAAAGNGKYPVIIYSLGQNDYTQESTVLCEFLASNGYIVISVPQWGPLPRKHFLMIDEEQSFETQVRDLEFITAMACQMPNADRNKIVAAGHSMGGVYSLLLAMRNKNIRMVIGLDASFTSYQESYTLKYWNLPYYDQWNFRIPLIQLCKKEEPRNDEVVNALKFSERYIITFPKLIHSDFSSFPMVTSLAPANNVDDYALQHRSQQDAVTGYEEVCRIFLSALQKYLFGQGDITATNEKIEFFKATDAPGEEGLYNLLVKDGLNKASEKLRQAIANYPGDTLIREKAMNRIAFECAISNRLNDAIGMYILNSIVYPKSDGVYRRLADAYIDAGDAGNAKLNYEKALQLNPGNEDAKNALDKLKGK